MKTITFSNQKGGVGKTAIACQYAYFLESLGLKVLVIDMDHQKNASKSLSLSSNINICNISAYDLLSRNDINISSLNLNSFTLIQGDEKLLKLEKNGNLHNEYANNYAEFMEKISKSFDVCLIDTNPNPDIRQTISLIVSGFVISPIQLNQEAIDGIGKILKQLGNISNKLNPAIKFIGILPNLVEPTKFQKDNFDAIKNKFPNLLIDLDTGDYAYIKRTTAFAEAQAFGLPVNKLNKTSGFKLSKELKKIFYRINNIINV